MFFHRLCVFCGSSFGSRPAYREAAIEFGTLLAERGIELVYGGGNIGLMGILADTSAGSAAAASSASFPSL